MSFADLPGPLATPEPLPEGAEVAPPGVRAMAALRWGLVALTAVLAVGAWVGWAGAPEAPTAAARWQCPMHPSIVQAVPGPCPVCGMDLVPAAQAAEGHAHERAGQAGAERKGRYWCPMHPEVQSDDPEARCEKCGGMKLVPRDDAGAAPGVSGLAPVDLGAERTQRIGVRTAPVVHGPIGPELRTVGAIAADEARVAIVSARVTGWVESLLVKEGGGRVRRGQALATVYSAELLAAEQAFLAAPPPAGSQAARTQGAGAFGFDPARRLELLGMAPQDVTALRETGQILYAQPLRAPIDGWVVRRGAYAGQYVQPGTELFQLVDLSTVWLLVDVHQDDLPRVAVGQRARLTLAARPGETFVGRVDHLYPALDPEARTLRARVALRNPGLALRPGMVGDVVLEGAAADGLSVPSEAVVDTGDRRYVFVARGAGRFEPRQVRTGVRADDRVQVLEGLTAGEQVVTTAGFLVDSESRVRAALDGFAAAER